MLRDLTDQDLKDLGIVLGDRRKLLRAIGELGRVPGVARAGSSAASLPISAAAAPRAIERKAKLAQLFPDLIEG